MRWLALAFLGVYSAALLYLEWRYSQRFVRPYLGDILGPAALYGVNTSLSVFLLWSCALVHGLCLALAERTGAPGRDRLFHLSQILVFVYLGFDDRFVVHERIGIAYGFNDAILIAGLGVLELGLLATLGRLRERSRRALVFLGASGLLFAAMAAIDAFAAAEARMRLSSEDLAKLWAGVFLLLFAVELLRELHERAVASPVRRAAARPPSPARFHRALAGAIVFVLFLAGASTALFERGHLHAGAYALLGPRSWAGLPVAFTGVLVVAAAVRLGRARRRSRRRLALGAAVAAAGGFGFFFEPGGHWTVALAWALASLGTAWTGLAVLLTAGDGVRAETAGARDEPRLAA